MIKLNFFLLVYLLSNILVNAQAEVNIIPYFQLGAMYYSSENVTSAGVGPGIGLSADFNKHILVETSANIYWINGNAGTFRLAVGYKKNGFWAPAIYLGLVTIFGDRTEILLEDGSRPIKPIFSIGLRLSPLRFENEKGFVSALEIGYGIGNYNGRNLEISALSIGVRF